MGLFKQMKDMKQAVEAAPGIVQQAQALGAQAQQFGLAQQAVAQQQAAQAQAAAAAAGVDTTAGAPGQLAPIAGVSIEQFAAVSKGLAAHAYDQTKAPLVAAQHGIAVADWEIAMAGWNGRITADPAIGQAFNAAYQRA